MPVNTIGSDRFCFEVSLDRATCASLWSRLRGTRRVSAQRLRRAISAEVEFDTESQSYSVVRVGNHHLPVSLTIRPGTDTHSSISRLLASNLKKTCSLPASRASGAQQLITQLERIIGRAGEVYVQTVELTRTDFEIGRSFMIGQHRRTNRPRNITRLSPSISLALDDEPPTILPAPSESDSEHILDRLRQGVRLGETIRANVLGNLVEVSGSIATHDGAPNDFELYLHWGRYDSQGIPWRDERVYLEQHTPGMSKFKHRLHISEAGSYGATLYVQPLNIATPVWLGHSSREDVRFTVREDDGREYHAQEVALARAEKRALEELRTALGSREALTAAREQIHARSPYLAVGKLLSVIAKDRFSRERLFDTYRDARDCIDNDDITRIIKAYGIGEVVFISPEGPHAGAGGLAQVISGLVPELERNEIPTTIIAPLYEEAHGNRHLSARETIRRGIRLGSRTVKPTLVGEVTVHLGPTFWADGSGLKRWPATVPLQVLCAEFGSARIFLLRNVSVFDRLYRPVLADEQLRRAIVLSRGALEAIATPRFGIRPSVIISNDWMTAFVPALVATDKRYRTHACLEGTTTLHMVHNGGADYQGKVPCRFYGEDVWPMLGLAPEHTFGFRDPVHPDLLNPTAAAARHATNGILTVSQPYAYQLTQPWGGDGLDVILSQRPESVFGISNGISRREIDAFFDRIAPGNPHRLAVDSLLDRKKAVRIRLQERYGLTIDGDATLVSFVGRLAEQKGLRLLSNWTHGEAISVLESILIRRPEVQILVAGPETADDTSAQELVHVLRHLVERYPGRIAFSIDYIPHPAALEIIFGSTFFLMPSRFEPGGITQLEALAAGTLVVARNVGGISTTIENFNPSNGTGNGFLCNEYDPTAFKNTLLWAIESASRMHTYRHLVAAARSARHDWGDRIPNYQALFRRLLLSHDELKEFESLGLS